MRWSLLSRVPGTGGPGSEDRMASTELGFYEYICPVSCSEAGQTREGQPCRKTFYAESLDVSLRSNREVARVFP